MPDAAADSLPSDGQRRRRFGCAMAILAVLSVLVPALVFGVLGWRSESAKRGEALAAAPSADPEQVAAIWVDAQANGWPDVLRAVAGTTEAAEPIGGMRGLRDVSISPSATSDESATSKQEGQARVRVTFVTSRPLPTGEPPGSVQRFVTLASRDGRWVVISVGAAP